MFQKNDNHNLISNSITDNTVFNNDSKQKQKQNKNNMIFTFVNGNKRTALLRPKVLFHK